MATCCVGLAKEVAGPGLEKLKSMLGSTPAGAETNEFGLELDPSPKPALLAAKEGFGPGDDMPCRAWKACGFI